MSREPLKPEHLKARLIRALSGLTQEQMSDETGSARGGDRPARARPGRRQPGRPALSGTADPVARSLAMAPLDDEPDDDDFDGGLSEARREADEGRVLSHDEMKRALEIP